MSVSESAYWLEKLNSDQMDIPGFLLPPYSRLDWRHSSGNQCRRCNRRGGDRQRNNRTDGQLTRACDKRAKPAYIEGFCKFDELIAMRVSSANEQRHLQMDALETPALVDQCRQA